MERAGFFAKLPLIADAYNSKRTTFLSAIIIILLIVKHRLPTCMLTVPVRPKKETLFITSVSVNQFQCFIACFEAH